MTPRLTAPQFAVLRALDALPEGERITAKEGGFSGNAAASMLYNILPGNSEPIAARKLGTMPRRWWLTPAGRTLVARLKAEGAL